MFIFLSSSFYVHFYIHKLVISHILAVGGKYPLLQRRFFPFFDQFLKEYLRGLLLYVIANVIFAQV